MRPTTLLLLVLFAVQCQSQDITEHHPILIDDSTIRLEPNKDTPSPFQEAHEAPKIFDGDASRERPRQEARITDTGESVVINEKEQQPLRLEGDKVQATLHTESIQQHHHKADKAISKKAVHRDLPILSGFRNAATKVDPSLILGVNHDGARSKPLPTVARVPRMQMAKRTTAATVAIGQPPKIQPPSKQA